MIKYMSGIVGGVWMCVWMSVYLCVQYTHTHIDAHITQRKGEDRDTGEERGYCKLLITVESNSRMHACLLISFPIFGMLEIFLNKVFRKKISIC